MGKTKRNKKFKADKPNPTGLTSVKDSQEEELPQRKEPNRLVQQIMDKFQSATKEEKICGAYLVCNLLEDSAGVSNLLNCSGLGGLLKTMSPMLLDESQEVRVAVAGALRNLSAEGGFPACDAMLMHDVSTPLLELLSSYKDFTKCDDAMNGDPKPKIADPRMDTYIQALNLLFNLCEANSIAVNMFNKSALLQVLISALDYNLYTVEAAIVSARCMHVISENNHQMAEAVSCSTQATEALQATAKLDISPDSRLTLLKTLTAGILFNIYDKSRGELVDNLLMSLMGDLASVLSISIVSKLNALAENGVEYSNTETVNESVDLINIVQSQQVALEIITNLCYTDNGSESGSEVEDTEDEDSEQMITEDEELIDLVPCPMPMAVYEAVVGNKLPMKVLNKVVYPADGVELKLQQLGHVLLLSEVATLRSRSLTCISNMSSCLSVEDFGGVQFVYDVWRNLAKLMTNSDVSGIVFFDSLLNAMRCMLQKLADCSTDSPLISELTPADIGVLSDVYGKTTDCNVKSGIVRVIGRLGFLLSKHCETNRVPTVLQTMEAIGTFFTASLTSEFGNLPTVEGTVVACEILDAIMDTFAEDYVDDVIDRVNLLQKVNCHLTALRTRTVQFKSRFGDRKVFVQTVRTNIARFVKYHTNRRKGQA